MAQSEVPTRHTGSRSSRRSNISGDEYILLVWMYSPFTKFMYDLFTTNCVYLRKRTLDYRKGVLGSSKLNLSVLPGLENVIVVATRLRNSSRLASERSSTAMLVRPYVRIDYVDCSKRWRIISEDRWTVFELLDKLVPRRHSHDGVCASLANLQTSPSLTLAGTGKKLKPADRSIDERNEATICQDLI